MNPRQQKFIDEYIKCSNATQAAINAGYSVKNAASIGYENLRKPYILAEVERRLAELKSERTADVQESLETLTKILRGELTEIRISASGKKFKCPPSIADRISAADKILRMNGAYKDKQEIKLSGVDYFIKELEQSYEFGEDTS